QFLAVFAMANMESTLGLLVKDKWSWNLQQTGIAFAYVGIIQVFSQGFLIRKLMPRWGEARMMLLGLLLASIGLSGIGIANTIGILAVAVTLLAFGNSFFNPSALGSLSLLSGAAEQGAVMGVGQSFSAPGRILGPATGGEAYQIGQRW